MVDCKAVNTPVEPRSESGSEEGEGTLMDPVEARRYRRSAARWNYLALDRVDLSVCANLLARSMARPTVGDERGIKRAIRYLSGAPRCIWKFHGQKGVDQLCVYSDSDWAGCLATRRSTSGGIVYHGAHPITHWSKRQNNVALSSGEAELNGQVKAISEVMGIKHAAHEMGMKVGAQLRGDSSAAQGILTRKGVGKVKHLEVKHLWVQEKVREGAVKPVKVPRIVNVADLLTHPCSGVEMGKHLGRSGVEVRAAQ